MTPIYGWNDRCVSDMADVNVSRDAILVFILAGNIDGLAGRLFESEHPKPLSTAALTVCYLT